jgi:hypothetical protein
MQITDFAALGRVDQLACPHHCRRESACHVRRIWKTKKIFFLDDD